MIPSMTIIPYIKNIMSCKPLRNRTNKSRLPVTQSPLVITNRPRSFPYQAEASSKSTGGVFQVRIKSGRTGEFSSVESVPTPCEDASKYSFEYDTTRYESYILYLFLRFIGFGISLAISSSRHLRQCGGQSSRCDRSFATFWRDVVPESGQRNWSHCSELARGMGPQSGRVG